MAQLNAAIHKFYEISKEYEWPRQRLRQRENKEKILCSNKGKTKENPLNFQREDKAKTKGNPLKSPGKSFEITRLRQREVHGKR